MKTKLFKFFQYAYLFFAVVFLYDAVNKYMTDGSIAYMSLLLAATAVFMFFFRRKFNKRFEDKE
ncbi:MULTISPECIES: hypothetical protein [Mangrovimonas]|uniref:Uncharacterized protein n=2 Tax=Mangrovimonas TaxID=1211036 RepID=A0A3R9NRI5_9FLAO|nr:hypothetical protein [Mangrovimonas spongiae]RSK41933.1 hypothetical protein EJA19_03375 [Mangrovimonas spongiae]